MSIFMSIKSARATFDMEMLLWQPLIGQSPPECPFQEGTQMLLNVQMCHQARKAGNP